MSFFKNRRNLIIVIAAVVVLIAGGITAFALLQMQPEPHIVEQTTIDKAVVDLPEVVEPEPTWPLTGMPLEDESRALYRPLSVKIENSWDARPQTGLGSADIVYETITEGGITRFNCLFQSTVPDNVGPVRSARNSDISIVPQYQGLLFFSGANDLVLGQLAGAGIDSMKGGSVDGLYYRVDFRYAPHNLYLNLGGAYAAAEADGFAIRTENPPTLEFSKPEEHPSPASGSGSASSGSASSGVADTSIASNASVKPASAISIPFSDSFIADWQYNAESKQYLRSMDGPTIDDATGEQVGVENLVIMWASFVPDPVGGTTLEVNLNGSGRAMVFTDGQWVEGTWETEGNTPPRFKDGAGKAILLSPGQSWFSVVDSETAVNVQ
ncbi:MAG: DUF3048 domain-containing protein [Coriobacteriales bacterium]|jgi:hypothetical protein|nr:DUF3048 domain-containing protein [Coriobacteriales bacterium]